MEQPSEMALGRAKHGSPNAGVAHSGFLHKVARKSAAWFSRTEFIVYRFDLRTQAVPGITPDLAVRLSTDAAPVLEALGGFPDRYEIEPRNLESFRRWLSEGEICFSAWAGGQLAFYGWMQFRCRRPAPLTRLPISPGGAFIYRCYTSAEFRGRKIYPAALAFAFQELKSRGVGRAFIDHATENVSSRRGIKRAGAVPIGRYTLFRFGLARWASFEPRVRIAVSGPASSPTGEP